MPRLRRGNNILSLRTNRRTYDWKYEETDGYKMGEQNGSVNKEEMFIIYIDLDCP